MVLPDSRMPPGKPEGRHVQHRLRELLGLRQATLHRQSQSRLPEQLLHGDQLPHQRGVNATQGEGPHRHLNADSGQDASAARAHDRALPGQRRAQGEVEDALSDDDEADPRRSASGQEYRCAPRQVC